METVWVLGDQLNRDLSAMRDTRPGSVRVLMVESRAKVASQAFHRQRLHPVLTSMRRFAEELRSSGFEVDYRRADTLPAGLEARRRRFRPATVRATEPASRDGVGMLRHHGVEVVRSNQFLCHYEEFAAWAAGQRRVRMEDFYRWRRQVTGCLMDGDEPSGGRWNFDAENRRTPPRSAAWPAPVTSRLDDVDHEVEADLPP